MMCLISGRISFSIASFTAAVEPGIANTAFPAAMPPTARLNIAPTQVHALSARAVQSMRRDWAWLVEGAEGWERYAPPSEALPGKTEQLDP